MTAAPHWSAAVVANLAAARLLADDETLTPRQIAVLALSCHPADDRRTVRSMAEECGVQKPAITRAADKLVVLGLVRRKHDPRDLRSVFITATDQGRGRAADLSRMIAPHANA